MNINDLLPDGVIGSIMSFADYGGSSGWSVRRPAAMYGCVCKRWHGIYASTSRGDIFVAENLSRLLDWSIETNNMLGHGGMQRSIVNKSGWWTSDYVFEGGRWVDPHGDPVLQLSNSEGGPFRVREGFTAPELVVTFQGPVQLRAVMFSARNRPRKILLKKLPIGNDGPRKAVCIEQQSLLLLHHSSKCQEEGNCKVNQCGDTKELWRHMAQCRDFDCHVPRCYSGRTILSHYRTCKERKCLLCKAVREVVRNQRSGRNKNQIQQIITQQQMIPQEQGSIELEYPPPLFGEGNPFHSDQEIPDYDLRVELMLPEGNAASDNEQLEFNLPVVIPGDEPFIIDDDERLSITVLESHERGWVGINSLMLYGAVLPEQKYDNRKYDAFTELYELGFNFNVAEAKKILKKHNWSATEAANALGYNSFL